MDSEQFISKCKNIAESSVDLAEYMSEMDGGIEELSDEERKAMTVMFNSITVLANNSGGSIETDDNSDDGRAFY